MSSYNIKFIISNYPQSTLEHNLRGVTIRALSPSVKKWNSTFACHSLRTGSSTCYSCFWYICTERMTSPLGAKGKSLALALAKGTWLKSSCSSCDRRGDPSSLHEKSRRFSEKWPHAKVKWIATPPKTAVGPIAEYLCMCSLYAKHWAKPQVNALSLYIQ